MIIAKKNKSMVIDLVEDDEPAEPVVEPVVEQVVTY